MNAWHPMPEMDTKTAQARGRLGGQARSQNLSPARRREVARWTVAEQVRQRRGGQTESRLVAAWLAAIRERDLDLALMVRHIFAMPFMYQDRFADLAPLILSEQERAVLQQTMDAVRNALQAQQKPLTPSYFEREPV